MGWLCTVSRFPSAAAAASNPGWSLALLVPWSETMTAPITLSTNGSDVNAVSALTQSAGRLNVGMPTATSARPGAGTGAYHPACFSVTALSVVMSNQIQPPSSNGSRPISNSTGSPENSAPPTVMRAPVALVRYRSTRPLPVSSTRSTTDCSVDQRRQ